MPRLRRMFGGSCLSHKPLSTNEASERKVAYIRKGLPVILQFISKSQHKPFTLILSQSYTAFLNAITWINVNVSCSMMFLVAQFAQVHNP
jgi:hypothetical protein